MVDKVGRIRWNRIKSVSAASLIAPPLPGIYAYAEIDGLAGLPQRIDWIYIGLARNLQKRLAQHEYYGEKNVDLRYWLSKAGDEAELWYAILEVEHLRKLEVTLIKRLNPRYNRIQYKRRKANGK